jgi:hypothetical protein
VTSTTESHTGAIAGRTLTREQVLDIRKRRYAGEKLRSITLDYDVSASVISRICLGKSYQEFPGPTLQVHTPDCDSAFPETRNNQRRVHPNIIPDEKRELIMQDFRGYNGTHISFCKKHGISEHAFNGIISDFESMEFVRMVKREAKRDRDLMPADKVRELLGPGGKYYGGPR